MGREPLFQGISAPQLTPFYDNGEVNYEEYTRLTRYLVQGGVKGIFVCGTTGEFANLTVEERKKLLKAAQAGVCGDCKILFNVTALNLKDAEELIAWSKQEKADAVSITPPYYHGYDEEALVSYFVTLSKLAEPLPVYLYNIPSMVKNAITPAVLKRVCEICDNVWGIKDSSMDFMTFLNFQLAVSDPEFEIITGNDAQVLTALQAGGCGAVIALAGVFPQLCNSVYSNYKNGNYEEARNAQIKIIKLRDLVRSTMPVMAHKEMLKMQGFEMGDARFPFRDLTEAEKKKITDTVSQLM